MDGRLVADGEDVTDFVSDVFPDAGEVVGDVLRLGWRATVEPHPDWSVTAHNSSAVVAALAVPGGRHVASAFLLNRLAGDGPATFAVRNADEAVMFALAADRSVPDDMWDDLAVVRYGLAPVCAALTAGVCPPGWAEAVLQNLVPAAAKPYSMFDSHDLEAVATAQEACVWAVLSEDAAHAAANVPSLQEALASNPALPATVLERLVEEGSDRVRAAVAVNGGAPDHVRSYASMTAAT